MSGFLNEQEITGSVAAPAKQTARQKCISCYAMEKLWQAADYGGAYLDALHLNEASHPFELQPLSAT
jgi:hypothetical protein